MQVTTSVGLSVVATVVSLAVATFAWHRREVPGAIPLTAFTVATATWTGGNALQAASTTLSAKLFWVNVQYVGIAVVPIAWFAFACEYTGRCEWLNRRTGAMLAVGPSLLLVLTWTNEYHHLVRVSNRVVTVGGTAVLRRTFGPVFWLGVVYSNLVNGVGTVMLLRGLVRSRRLFQRQSAAVLTGATVPWAAAFLFYNGLSPIEPEMFFSVTGFAFAVAISRYDLLDVAPLGRNAVLEEMDDPVLVVDGDDRIVDANSASRDLFEWSSTDAVVGQPITDVCGSYPALLRCYEARDAGEEVSIEDGDGIRRDFDVQFSSLSGDRTSGTALLLRDVTRLKRHERHLERQNEQLEAVGHTIAHDLRNPLNVAQGHLDLARDAADVDAVEDRLARVESAHERMDGIIEEALAVAKGEKSASPDRLHLRDVAERAWQNVDTERAELAFDGGDVPVLADQGLLASAFENLFRNAVEHGSTSPRSQTHEDAVEHGSAGQQSSIDDVAEHGSENGRLEIDDSDERRSSGVTVRVGALDGGEGFYVEDDGPGIPVEERERAFERGFTTAEDGTGVGLAVVADVAERHDWEVVATESAMGGARFEVRGVENPTVPSP